MPWHGPVVPDQDAHPRAVIVARGNTNGKRSPRSVTVSHTSGFCRTSSRSYMLRWFRSRPRQSSMGDDEVPREAGVRARPLRNAPARRSSILPVADLREQAERGARARFCPPRWARAYEAGRSAPPLAACSSKPMRRYLPGRASGLPHGRSRPGCQPVNVNALVWREFTIQCLTLSPITAEARLRCAGTCWPVALRLDGPEPCQVRSGRPPTRRR